MKEHLTSKMSILLSTALNTGKSQISVFIHQHLIQFELITGQQIVIPKEKGVKIDLITVKIKSHIKDKNYSITNSDHSSTV